MSIFICCVDDYIQREMEEYLESKDIYADVIPAPGYFNTSKEYDTLADYTISKSRAVIAILDKQNGVSQAMRVQLKAAHKNQKPVIAYYVDKLRTGSRLKGLIGAAVEIYEYNHKDKQAARDTLFETIKRLLDLRYEEDCILSGTTYVKYTGKKTKVTVPEGITELGNHAFSNNRRLTSVTLPQSLKTIGKCAFWRCGKLKSVTIPDGVTTIKSGAFTGCGSLKSVIIPSGVTELMASTFSYCFELESVTLPDGITAIGSSVFYDCNLLKQLNMPASLETIGNRAFGACKGLKTVILPPSLKLIDRKAFSACDGLVELYIPKSVKEIGAFAFEYCASLSKITYLCTTANVGTGAFFSSCESISEIVLSKGVSLPKLSNRVSFPYERLLISGKIKGGSRKTKEALALSLIGQVVAEEGAEAAIKLLEFVASMYKPRVAPAYFVHAMIMESVVASMPALTAYLLDYKHTHYPNEGTDFSI